MNGVRPEPLLFKPSIIQALKDYILSYTVDCFIRVYRYVFVFHEDCKKAVFYRLIQLSKHFLHAAVG